MKRRRWRNEPAGPAARLRRNPRLLRAVVWLAAGTLGVLTGALFGGELLARALPERATHVRFAVIGNAHATARELVAAAGVPPRSALRSLDLARVRTALAAHPWVREARVAALPPDRLILAVAERTPVAVAELAGGPRLVDRDGVAFAPAPAGVRLPELRGVAAPAGPALAEGVALLAAIEARELPVPRAVILGGERPATLPALELPDAGPAPGARVLLGHDDADTKLARLAALLAAHLPELANAAEIDLRFGDQVVLRPRPETAANHPATPLEKTSFQPSRGGTTQWHARRI